MNPRKDPAGDEIGISDGLTKYVQRINAAVAYTGNDDHEDVRSILKEFRAAQVRARLLEVIETAKPKGFERFGDDEWQLGSDAVKGFNKALSEYEQSLRAAVVDGGKA